MALDRVVLAPPIEAVAVAVEAPRVIETPPALAPPVATPDVEEKAGPVTEAPSKEPVLRAAKPARLSGLAVLVVVDAGVKDSPPDQDESLRTERLLIDAARAALTRDASTALEPLTEHANRFPGGQLTEEREALMVQALVLTNDGTGARRRFEAFSRDFPGSPLIKALKAAVEATPESGRGSHTQ